MMLNSTQELLPGKSAAPEAGSRFVRTGDQQVLRGVKTKHHRNDTSFLTFIGSRELKKA